MPKTLSATNIAGRLVIKGMTGGNILFDGRIIGRFVCYGNGRGGSVFASRIYKPFTIEEEAGKTSTLTQKVAKALAKKLKETGIDADTLGAAADTTLPATALINQ